MFNLPCGRTASGFPASRRYFPNTVIAVVLLEVSDKLQKAVGKLRKIAFVQFSRESEIMILYSLQVITDKK